jgi:vesicular inhibitory amino acid transporter
MFIVGLPQAVRVGGWWAILALLGVAYICYYTGILLVQCLYDDKGKRVRSSYKAIAEECYPWGGNIVLGAQLTELLMTCILYLVLVGDLLEGCFPAAVLLPCAFLMDLTAVSRLSFWNTISHIIINIIILLYCMTQIGRWAWGSVRITFDINTFPTVIGVVVFGYTSHIFLPALEGSMIERSEFQPMLKWSHIAAGAFKAIFGFVGFLTFNEYTQDEISNSLPNQQFKVLVNVILVVKALLSYPLPYFATVQIVRQNLFLGAPKTWFSGCFGADGSMREWALSLRICLVLFTLFMALSTPYFVLLMGLVGNITGTLLSFVWPSLFHLKIKGHTLTDRQKWPNYAIIAAGLCFGAVGIVYSSLLLSDAINEVKEYE